jgi:exonuclease SbcC
MQAIAHRRASEARREAEFIAGQLAADYAQATEENLAARQAALAGLETERERVEADRLALEQGLRVAREVRRARREGETLASDLETERSRRESAAGQVAQLEEGLAEVRRRMHRLQQALASSGYDERRLQQLLSAEPRAEELVRLERQREQVETEANEEQRREQRLAAEREEAERARAAGAEAERKGEAALQRARRQRDELRRRHVAAELRRHLRPGEPCPVCEQEIQSLPVEVLPALEEAEAQVEAARERLEEERRRSAAAGIRAGKLRAERGASRKRLDELSTRADVVRQAREEVRQALLALGFGPLELAQPADLRERVAGERARLADGQRKNQRLEKDRDKLEAERARLDREAAAARAQVEASTVHAEKLEARRHDVEGALTEARQALARLAREHGWAEPALTSDGGDEVSELERRRAAAQQRVTALTGAVEGQRTELAALQQSLARAAELQAARERLMDQAAVAGRLAQLLQANQLLAYIQEEALARLARDGSGHLLTLSQGRYSLVCEEQEFFVLDHWHADTRRSVRTLSGGETFLASLALALALAEGLASLCAEGRASESLESLFLDEGFGTLDAEALDLVVQAIESLHGGRRLVGVITHIPELAERLPARVSVEPGAGGARIVT